MLLDGPTYPGSSINLGKLTITRNADGVVQDIAFTPQPYDEKENAIINVNKDGTMVAFDHLKTSGAFRLVRKDNALQITPVPQQNPFKIELDLAHYLPNNNKVAVSAEPFEAGGTPVFTATQDGRKLTITLTPTTIFALTIQ